jgi:hypothetical protein
VIQLIAGEFLSGRRWGQAHGQQSNRKKLHHGVRLDKLDVKRSGARVNDGILLPAGDLVGDFFMF